MGSRPRLEALTGARIVAAALVLLGHLPMPEGFRTAMPITTHHFTAVGMFFILSGFVIAYTYTDSLSVRHAPVGRYLWFRFARIYPAYAIAVVLAVPLGIIEGDTIASLWRQLTLTQSWSNDRSVVFAWNPVTWSVSTEAVFYLLFPIVARIALPWLRSPRRALAGAAFAWITMLLVHLVWFERVGQVDYWLYVFPPIRTLEFLIGVCLGCAFVRGLRMERATVAPIALLALLLMVPGQSVRPLVYPLLTVPLIAAAIFSLTEDRRPARLLSGPRMRLLGETSYSFYLLHPLALAGGIALAQAMGMPADSGSGAMVTGAITIAGTLGAALVSYRTVEVPARSRLRRVARVAGPDDRQAPDYGPFPNLPIP